MKYCPNCGSETIRGANYCPICGAELRGYIYLKKEMEREKWEALRAEEVTDEDLIRFTGRNSGYYMKKWQKDNSWNWAAFVMAPFWLGYRKMYRVLLVLFGLLIVADAILRMVFGRIPGIPDILAGFLTALFCGLRGNGLYRKHAERQICLIRKNSRDAAALPGQIGASGGTSDSGIFYGLLILLGYLIFFAYM